MTSILISSFVGQQANLSGSGMKSRLSQDSCTFCGIIAGTIPAFMVYKDDKAIAFLDILPIRTGHTLLIPREHHRKMTDLPADISAHMASVLPRLCRAVCRATDQPDFNLVSNNGYAQVVDHVHWHIVPAPRLDDRASRISSQDSSLPIGLRELARREELDDDDAERLAEAIRKALSEEASSQSRL